MYSPKISEDLIPLLYQVGKAGRKPMTKVVDEMLRRHLSQYDKETRSLRSPSDATHSVKDAQVKTDRTAHKSHFQGGTYKGYSVSLRLVRERLEDFDPIHLSHPRDVYDLMREIEDYDKERFYALPLDVKNTLLGCDEVSRGSADGACLHLGDVFKAALLSNASRLVVVHNHPSGDITPSQDDKETTRQLRAASELLGMPLLDSIIIGRGKYYSFGETGELQRDKP